MPPTKKTIAKKAACGLAISVPLVVFGVLVVHALVVFALRYWASENREAYRVARDALVLCTNGESVVRYNLAAKCAQDRVWLDEWYWVIMVRQTIAHHVEEAHWLHTTLTSLTHNVIVLTATLIIAGFIFLGAARKGGHDLLDASTLYQQMRMNDQQLLLHAVSGMHARHNAIDLAPSYQPYQPQPQAAPALLHAPSKAFSSPFVTYSDADPWRNVPLEEIKQPATVFRPAP